ncbi:SAC domain-containing protein [Mycena indigotica]|uniref:SAC domain-containing protein n=1 Tax=Mycena indigotica TaxID=2126181 RepID=A0A8H6SW97_9AGAR|nr:SAC domain-containing protein [Mycena indigotica]KAF7306606.1 SAC domain-containing protein [Mycena indigotica]
MLHQRLQLYTQGNDAYIFVPDASVGPSLTIHRASGELALNSPHALPPSARRSNKTIYAILGIISLSLSDYVVVITEREFKGKLLGHDIYRAADYDLLPLAPNLNTYNPPHAVEAHLLALVRSHLANGVFLFSYTWDLTRHLQAQWQTREKSGNAPFWQTVDDRFFWNKYLQSRLIELTVGNPDQDLSPFIMPVMYGTFDIRKVSLRGRTMQLCLISRRSRFRAGTRYFRRGIDEEGHVANFNETEQLLLVDEAGGSDLGTQMSFVQIRGSVPVFWAEVNTLRYKPDLQVMDDPNTANMMRRHLQEQVATYGDQALVSLVNRKGYEQPVKEAYERYVAQLDLPNVRYQYFDFHNECKHMRWDRISVLIDQLEDDLEKHGYFHLPSNQQAPVLLQRGVVRTNCMDNLDRTNVVQAALARWTLNKQLRSLGILNDDDSIDAYDQVSQDFREMWADHADAIAQAYGGSGALKSDFTRTGKRTRKGLFDDGVKSSLRYIKNNFFDGARQDGFDLVSGKWAPPKNPASSMFLVTDSRPLLTRAMPLAVSFSLFMICAGLTLPRTSGMSCDVGGHKKTQANGMLYRLLALLLLHYVVHPPFRRSYFYIYPRNRLRLLATARFLFRVHILQRARFSFWATWHGVGEWRGAENENGDDDEYQVVEEADGQRGSGGGGKEAGRLVLSSRNAIKHLFFVCVLPLSTPKMAKAGVKRASPGADEEKNPLANVDLSEEDAKSLQQSQRDLGRVELAMDRLGQTKVGPAYERRRAVVKKISKFWPVALMNHTHFAYFAQHSADQLALSYLEDLWIARDPVEPRCYTIEFHFKENPFFTNTVLKKEYKYNAPPPNAENDQPDENGITETMLDFSWERDVEAQAFKIDWKDPEKALTKLYPGEAGEDEDDEPVEPGTFFNFFEKGPDGAELGITIANEVFPEAIEYFLGQAGGMDDDSVDSDEDDDDDDEAEEIDLEKPRPKKQKV